MYILVSICKELTAPENGKIICGETEIDGSTNVITFRSCKVTCDPGFLPSHQSTRLCQGNGTWSGRTALCQGEYDEHLN